MQAEAAGVCFLCNNASLDLGLSLMWWHNFENYRLGHNKLMLCFTDPAGSLFSTSQIKYKSCDHCHVMQT